MRPRASNRYSIGTGDSGWDHGKTSRHAAIAPNALKPASHQASIGFRDHRRVGPAMANTWFMR